MPELPRVILPFGQALDRESGLMAVQPGTFEDLRNLLLHQGKLVVRPGFTDGLTLVDDVGTPVSHIVQGQRLQPERLGITVSYQEATQRVWVHRVDPDMTLAELLGEWVNPVGWASTPPKVSMAESYGRVFMAHDAALIGDRAPTIFYDPVFSAGALVNLTADFQGLGVHNIRFRGVVRHLKYLFGWGYGDEANDRAEFVRSSVAGDPTIFEPNHYFIAGDRQSPVLTCRVGGGRLIVQKESEGHVIFGSGRDDFGIDILDPLYGVLQSQLATNYSGLVVAWSAEGPRVWDGQGPSQEISIPLDLFGPDPAGLVVEGDSATAFAHYLPDLRIVVFVFGRRVYALTVRVEGDWKWSYWELGFDPLCAFTLFRGVLASVPPVGYPEYVAPDDPASLVDALALWRYADLDALQPRFLEDQSRSGNHLWFAGQVARDSVLARGPFGSKKQGVVHGGMVQRSLGLANTGQALNLGGAGENVRLTVNFTADLDAGNQGIIAQDDGAADRGWWIMLGAAGAVSAFFTSDGSGAKGGAATVALSTVFADWADMWLRVEFNIGTNELVFETSPNGVDWTALGAAVSFGAGSFHQPAATTPVEFGSISLATTPLLGGAVYRVIAEEDPGGGYVLAWSFNADAALFTDLVAVGTSQGVAHARDPVDSGTFLRFDGLVSAASTFHNALAAALSAQFDVAPGEFLTVVFAAAMDQVGPTHGGGTFHTPFAHRVNFSVPGWSPINDGGVDGFSFVVDPTDAAPESTPVFPIVVDDELAGTIYEIDGPAGEIRMRKLGAVVQVGAYTNVGSGAAAIAVTVGTAGTGLARMAMDFYGMGVWKRELTALEKQQAVDYLFGT